MYFIVYIFNQNLRALLKRLITKYRMNEKSVSSQRKECAIKWQFNGSNEVLFTNQGINFIFTRVLLVLYSHSC